MNFIVIKMLSVATNIINIKTRINFSIRFEINYNLMYLDFNSGLNYFFMKNFRFIFPFFIFLQYNFFLKKNKTKKN